VQRLQVNDASEPSTLTVRAWSDLVGLAVLIALGWSLAQVAFVLWPQVDTLTQRALHTGCAVALAFALFARRTGGRGSRALLNALALLVFVPTVYVAWNAQYITSGRVQGLDPVSPAAHAMGLLLLVLLFEAGRRVLGWGLAIFVLTFVAYFFAGPLLPGQLAHHFTGLENFIDAQFLSLHGIFGVPVGVSVSTVFYFILFAAVYDIYGGGRMIIELAFALTGRAVGGPAKAATVASGMLGSVSGSAVANVMSTGIFTIPLMQRAGYSPRFAGAVEAAASTGGQLVPPVMGVAAFIMADYLQTSYQRIVLAAILPSIVYYAALLLMVDLQARVDGLRRPEGVASRPLRDVMLARGHLLLPLVWLVYRIVAGHPVENAALEASGLTLAVGTLRAGTRRGPLALIKSLVVAAERAVSVALPCALAGVVVAVISFTGLGTKFTGLMTWLAGGNLAFLLVLTMIASLVLGTGMPTTSAYIMAAVLLAPALVSVGVEPLVAHFFIFYFAILSMVTPPVALASYAAASISRASPSATGWTAFALCMPGFMIPFMAILHPGLLLIGSPMDSAWGMLNVLLGIAGLAVALIGWLFKPLSMAWRIFFVSVGLLILLPHVALTMVSVGLLVVGAFLLWRDVRRHASGTSRVGG
jgi:TRAP transporter 4TM/12TM fusion protein